MRDAGIVTGVAVAVDGERIAAVGPQAELERDYPRRAPSRLRGRRAHARVSSTRTRTRFSASRASRNRSCARPGSTTWRSRGEAAGSTRPCATCAPEPRTSWSRSPSRRLRRLAAHGVTTVEVKSGYGLTLEDELKIAPRDPPAGSELFPCGWCRRGSAPTRSRSKYRATADGRSEYVRLLVSTNAPRRRVGGARPFRGRILRAGRVHDRRVENDSRRRAVRRSGAQAPRRRAAPVRRRRARGGDRRHVGRPSRGHLRRRESARSPSPPPSPRCFPERCSSSERTSRRRRARSSMPAPRSRWRPTSIPARRRRRTFRSILTLGVSQLRLSVAEAFVAATVNGAAALSLADRDRPDRAGLLRRPRAVRCARTCASCRTGTATSAASARGCAGALVIRTTVDTTLTPRRLAGRAGTDRRIRTR